MKLRRHHVYTSRASGKPFYRYDLSPPPDLIHELGWEKGDELEARVENGELHIRRRVKPPQE